jgi:hypothetical protein
MENFSELAKQLREIAKFDTLDLLDKDSLQGIAEALDCFEQPFYLASYLSQKHGYIHAFWNKDDIRDSADRLNVTLTEEEVDKIAEKIANYWDAEVGINWHVIEEYILNK